MVTLKNYIMVIDGIEYKYRVTPKFDKVYAEVFHIWENNGIDHEIPMISKSFKRWFKPINDSDYKDAREWCDNHIKNIYISKQ